MDENHPFTRLIRDLIAEIGLPPAGEVASPVELTVDDFTLVLSTDARSEGEDIVLYAGLGTVPAARELEVYRVLLEANLLWSGTGNATLGVNSATREAMLCHRLPIAELTGGTLAALCGRFIEIARGWRNAIESAAEADGAASASAQGGDDSVLMLRI